MISKAGGWRQIDGLLGIFHPVLPFGLWLTLRMAPSSSLVGSLSFFIVGGFAVRAISFPFNQPGNRFEKLVLINLDPSSSLAG